MKRVILSLIFIVSLISISLAQPSGGWYNSSNNSNIIPVNVTQSATPAINTNNIINQITGLAQAITSFTTNLTGSPSDGSQLEIIITDNGTARALSWGASFASSTVTLPTTTVLNTPLRVFFQWSASLSQWICVGVA